MVLTEFTECDSSILLFRLKLKTAQFLITTTQLGLQNFVF